jgi:CMP-N-acetylneuraminic acid synthetase
MDLRFVALVPMKGHSERIPGKNLRLLEGRPLCFWILDVLSRLPDIERIVVNTDSPEIAARCREAFGVVIHERPPELCGDRVPMNRIIAHDLGRLTGDEHFLQTHATNPLLTAATLRRALSCYAGQLDRRDSLFSVTRRASRFWDEQGRPVNHDPAELLRTQDLPPLFEENSCFYLFSRSSFQVRGNRIGERPALFELDPREALDLDEPADWSLAEALLRARGADSPAP